MVSKSPPVRGSSANCYTSGTLDKSLRRRRPSEPFHDGQKGSEKYEASYLFADDTAVSEGDVPGRGLPRSQRRLPVSPPRVRAIRPPEIDPRCGPRHVARPEIPSRVLVPWRPPKPRPPGHRFLRLKR